MEEENYKFRLSAFKEPLLEWLTTTPNRASLAFRHVCPAHPPTYSRPTTVSHHRPRLLPQQPVVD